MLINNSNIIKGFQRFFILINKYGNPVNHFGIDHRSFFKTFNQVQDQGGSIRTTTVIVNYFEDWPYLSNEKIEPERRF